MTKTVTIAATRTNGDPYAHHDVIVTLVAGSAGGVVGSNVIVSQTKVPLDADGEGSIVLATNDVEITSPATSFYRFTVEGSSPTITRSVRITDALPSTISWTRSGIEVGDPTIPQRDVSSDYVQVPGHGSVTNVLTALGGTVAATAASLVTAEDNIVTLQNDVTDLETGATTTDTRLDTLEVGARYLAGRDEVRTEAAARTSTAPLFALCTPWGGSHDSGGYTTPAPADFAAGMYLRATITVLPLVGYDDPADGDTVFSEVFTQTHDGLGIWDNFEFAVLRIWDASAGVWRIYPYLEWTEIGGTAEAHLLATTNTVTTDGVEYPPWEWVENVPTEIAAWLKFNDGGTWSLGFYERTIHGPSDFAFGGAEWALRQKLRGTTATTIDTGVTHPWGMGLGSGAIRMDGLEARDTGPTGTLLANPTAALGAVAGEGQEFDDGPGNTWTPGVDAAIYDPTAGGGGGAVDSVAGRTGAVVLTPEDLGSVTTARILGRSTSGTGAAEQLTAEQVRTLTGTDYGLAADTVVEGIALPRKTWRTGSYYGVDLPIANSGTAMASGAVRAMAFYNPVAGRAIDQLALDVFSASATPAAILYICTDDGTGYPGTVVASGAITPAATTRLTASVSYTLPRGLLWFVAHSTAVTWAGLNFSNLAQSPYLPMAASYSANGTSCWFATGAGTSALTSFPAGATAAASGLQISVRAA